MSSFNKKKGGKSTVEVSGEEYELLQELMRLKERARVSLPTSNSSSNDVGGVLPDRTTTNTTSSSSAKGKDEKKASRNAPSSLVDTLKSVGDGIMDIKDTEENIFTTLANSSRIDIFYRASGFLTLCFSQFRSGFERLLFTNAVNLWMLTVLCIFPFLFYVSLPYGKLSTSLSKAMMLPGNQSLFLQEIVSPIMLVYSFFYGGDWFDFGKKKPGF